MRIICYFTAGSEQSGGGCTRPSLILGWNVHLFVKSYLNVMWSFLCVGLSRPYLYNWNLVTRQFRTLIFFRKCALEYWEVWQAHHHLWACVQQLFIHPTYFSFFFSIKSSSKIWVSEYLLKDLRKFYYFKTHTNIQYSCAHTPDLKNNLAKWLFPQMRAQPIIGMT